MTTREDITNPDGSPLTDREWEQITIHPLYAKAIQHHKVAVLGGNNVDWDDDDLAISRALHEEAMTNKALGKVDPVTIEHVNVGIRRLIDKDEPGTAITFKRTYPSPNYPNAEFACEINTPSGDGWRGVGTTPMEALDDLYYDMTQK